MPGRLYSSIWSGVAPRSRASVFQSGAPARVAFQVASQVDPRRPAASPIKSLRAFSAATFRSRVRSKSSFAAKSPSTKTSASGGARSIERFSAGQRARR